MRTTGFLLFMMSCVFLGGCSLHPIPDDLSTENTFRIVNNIRCEVKDQVQLRLQELLDKSPDETVRRFPLASLNVFVREQGQAGILRILASADPTIAYKVLKYGSITIGYSFSFDITETNTNSANAGFRLPFTHTTFDLTAKGAANFTRQNVRTFAVSDLFLDLIALDCSGYRKRRGNFAYPIVGSIGVRNVIDTYLDLGKSGVTATEVAGIAGPFKDVITFTTEISGDISPTVTIAPVPNKFRLISAGGTFGAGRTDIHMLTIVIPFPALDDRPGSFLSTESFTAKEYTTAVENANKTIAYEFCIERAINGTSGALPGITTSPEQYCREASFR